MYICLNSRCKNIICTKINPHISLGLSSAFWRLVHLLDTLAEHCRDGDGVGELLHSLALQGRAGGDVVSELLGGLAHHHGGPGEHTPLEEGQGRKLLLDKAGLVMSLFWDYRRTAALPRVVCSKTCDILDSSAGGSQ